jgi:hypothetical protein
MEANVPLLAEDFEPGDRIYHHDTLNFRFGRVISVSDTLIMVEFDDGKTLGAKSPLAPY